MQVSVVVGGEVDDAGQVAGGTSTELGFRLNKTQRKWPQCDWQAVWLLKLIQGIRAGIATLLNCTASHPTAVKLTGLAPVLSSDPGHHKRGVPKVPANSWLVLARLPGGSLVARTFPPGSQVTKLACCCACKPMQLWHQP